MPIYDQISAKLKENMKYCDNVVTIMKLLAIMMSNYLIFFYCNSRTNPYQN